MNFAKKWLTAFAALAIAAVPALAQEDLGEPAITFKTNIYKTYGETNSFHLLIGVTEKSEYFDVDMGFGVNEFEAGYATVNSDGSWNGSILQCRVFEAGEVKIYGDPTKIDVLIADGCYISEIDLSRCTNLNVLNLEHNELTGLDLTPNTKLAAIYLTDNPGSAATPIKIGVPKPDLQILECDIIDHFDPDFRPDYPNLVSLDFYHTPGLSSIDLSGCPKLLNLVLEFTAVSKLDLSPVPHMWHLNIAETRITDIDLSKAPELMELLCSHTSQSINSQYKLKSLDLSKNPLLTYIAASDNNLTALDVSNNPRLKTLYLRHNSLSQLNLEKNDSLHALDLTGNSFTFSTLPAERETFSEYFYQQRPRPMPKAIARGAVLSFPEQLRSDGATYARVMRAPVGQAVDTIPDTAYSWNGEKGELVINECFSDSLYVEFGNAALASYAMTTAPFMVKEGADVGKPSVAVTFQILKNRAVSFKAGADGATPAAPKKLLMDFGDGELKEFSITSSAAESEITGTSLNYNMKLYVPEGEVLTDLNIDNLALIRLDVSAAHELRALSAASAGLTSVDLSYNRCLTALNLNGNRLSRLSLAGVSGDYEKNVLTRIEARDNRIAEFDIVNTGGCRWLDLAGNRLAEFNLKDYDSIQHLDLSGNALTELNLAYMGAARYINIANNDITELQSVIDMPMLETFDVSGNALNLATLPIVPCAGYIYAPQQPIVIAAKAPSVALDSQYREIGGQYSSFRWLYADGTAMADGTDCAVHNGITTFHTIDRGPVTCEITHPAFPQSTGDKVLKTTAVQPMGAPTIVVGTIKVSADNEGGSVGFTTKTVSNVYIDWTGERSDFRGYATSSQFSSHDGIPAEAAGKTAVMYTYDSPSDITVCSIGDLKMDAMDASAMTDCFAFMLYDSGISSENLKLPNPAGLTELTLTKADIKDMDFAPFTKLQQLNLSGSNLESIDLGKMPALQAATLGDNAITSASFNNPSLWGLDLSMNRLENIDLKGLPALSQLVVSTNQLSTIDLSPVASTLHAVVLSGNKFRFSTLPRKADLPVIGNVFYYGSQDAVPVRISADNKVDLSAEAMVGETATVYTWYYGDVTVDPETLEVSGEALDQTSSDPEVTVENGVSTFHVTDFDKPLTCVMTNTEYPNLVLYTEPLTVNQGGVSDITADPEEDKAVSVYSLSGVPVRVNVKREDALNGLTPGLYIISSPKKAEKVLVK